MYIYKTKNILNNKVYIGKSEKEFNKNYYGSGLLLEKAIKKYGKENFTIEMIDIANSIEELNEKEIYWIKKYKNNSYNLAEGGTGGWATKYYTKEQRKAYSNHLSKIRKGKTHTEETRKKLSLMHKGKKFGDSKKVSDTLKERWKDPNSIYNNPEFRKRLSEAGKKRIWTEEVKKKISDSRWGKNNPAAIRVQVDGKIYETRRECAKVFQISDTAVTKRCKSKNFPNWQLIDKT